ncbi:hypothetical protein N2152v2_008472 [Parachlorella kessleri]
MAAVPSMQGLGPAGPPAARQGAASGAFPSCCCPGSPSIVGSTSSNGISSKRGEGQVKSAAKAENEAVTRGLNRYIRRKKYDNIEYYLPALLAAKGQLIRSGYLLAQDPNSARVMLREGAFAGLRDNVRAVGEYAGQQGHAEEGSAAVTGFFKALEAYDYVLLQGARNKDGIDKEGSEAKLNAAVAALDKIVALVPDGMVSKAQQIVDELEAQVQAEREELAAEQAKQVQQKLEGLL